MVKLLLKHGETFTVKGKQFEVIHISGAENAKGELISFEYGIVLHSEAKAKRLKEKKLQEAEQAKAEKGGKDAKD